MKRKNNNNWKPNINSEDLYIMWAIVYIISFEFVICLINNYAC